MFVQSTLTRRSDLALCGAKVIVEVGVYQGHFAKELLETEPLAHVHLVDPWKAMGKETQHATYADLALTIENILPHMDRCTIHISPSLQTRIESPDLVYLDGDHSYEGVLADCEHWWEQLSPTGILAGHDIFTVDHLPVTQAVMDFAKRVNKEIYLINGDKNKEGHHVCAPSWYIP